MNTQQLQHARHHSGDGDALAADSIHHMAGDKVVFIMHLCGQQRRNPQAHKLAENVAQRQGVQEAQRMKPAFVAQIFLDLALQNFDAGQNIAVRMNDAFRGRRGAGSKENLQRRVRIERRIWLEHRRTRQRGIKIFESNFRGGFLRQFLQMHLIAHDQPRSYIRNHADRKVDATGRIQRDRNHATQHAAEKSCFPLGGVCAPQQNALAGRDAAIGQHATETSRQGCQLGIGRRDAPIAGIADDGDLFAVPLKILDESGEMLSHDRFGCW